MEHFEVPGRSSSYELVGLPGQGCNRCCNKGSGSAHLSATPWGLHPEHHSIRAMSTLFPHSPLHYSQSETGYDSRRTCNSCVPGSGAAWCFQQDYYVSGSGRQDDTRIACGTKSRYKLMPCSFYPRVIPWTCN